MAKNSHGSMNFEHKSIDESDYKQKPQGSSNCERSSNCNGKLGESKRCP